MAAIDAFGRFELGGGHEGGAVEAATTFRVSRQIATPFTAWLGRKTIAKGRFNVLLQHHHSQTSPDDHASFRVDDVPSDF